jgi:hypothetical protein
MNNGNISTFLDAIDATFPPYYLAVIRELEIKRKVRVRFTPDALKTDGGNTTQLPVAVSLQEESEGRGSVEILARPPRLLRNGHEIQWRSAQLAACLALGVELGKIYYRIKTRYGAALPEELEQHVNDFSIKIALRAGLIAFESGSVIASLKDLAVERPQILAERFKAQLFLEGIIPFTVPRNFLTPHSLYFVTRHANRAGTLLIGLFSERTIFQNDFLPEVAGLDQVKPAFALKRLNGSSPGTFVLALKKKSEVFGPALTKVRKVLMEIVDLHAERRDFKVAREKIAVNETAAERARRDRIERKVLQQIERRLELEPGRLMELESKAPGSVEKLLESTDILTRNNVKASN